MYAKNDSPWGSFTPQITRCHLYKWLKYAWLLLCFLFFLYISLKILSDVDSSFFQSLHFLPWLLVFGLAAAPGWLSELTDLSVAPVGQLWEYSEFILSGPLGSVLLSLSDYLLQWEIRSEEVTTFYLFRFKLGQFLQCVPAEYICNNRNLHKLASNDPWNDRSSR